MSINGITDMIRKEETKTRLLFVILYTVGLIGILIPSTKDIFIHLTPYILLLSFIFLIIFHSPKIEIRTFLAFFSVFLISFCVEVAGVNTGIIFGPYSYGKGLGVRLFNTPLMIGINWLLLVYCTYVIADKVRGGSFSKILTGSMIMVLYDLVMEQVAPAMDMWIFEGGIVPVRNYVSWFLSAMLFHFIFRSLGIRINNRLAPLIFLLQSILFISLFLIFRLVK